MEDMVHPPSSPQAGIESYVGYLKLLQDQAMLSPVSDPR